MTDFKRISDALNREDKKYLERMNQYLEELRALPPDKAKIEARRALIRTGVLDKNGNPKENIVTCSHHL